MPFCVAPAARRVSQLRSAPAGVFRTGWGSTSRTSTFMGLLVSKTPAQ